MASRADLKVHPGERPRHWYTQVPVVVPVTVSVLALAFSIVTTYESERRVARQDTHATRVELRGLVQRLIALPRENLEATLKYRNDPVTFQQVASQINTENIVLVREASDLMDEIPHQVSATQYYAVALAACLSGLTAECERRLNDGLRVADNVVDATALLRQYATMLFLTGHVDRGRAKWRDALDIFQRYPHQAAYTVAYTSGLTEYDWSIAELNLRNCRAALQHLRAAERYSTQIGPSPFTNGLPTAQRLLENRCGAPAG
jgi:hypothetical protein